MSTENLATAIASTRSVLAGVQKSQLGAPTPCAEWNVSALINHIVGGQFYFASAVGGTAASDGEVDYAAGNYLADFDAGSAMCLEAFGRDGALDAMHQLAFGAMPGAAAMNVCTTDTFTHGWDLARATGQSTDLAPAFATELLAGVRSNLPDDLRNEQGSPFGLEQAAPAGAAPADELAAFLGRRV
jgi:uncharacterized protein (TIGR03086 family)